MRTARLIIVRGGGSGALSPMGVTFLGSDTVASNLHHEIFMNILSAKSEGIFPEQPYTFVLDNRIGDSKPARPHDLALEHKKLKRTCVRPKYPSNIRRTGVHRDLGLYPHTVSISQKFGN